MVFNFIGTGSWEGNSAISHPVVGIYPAYIGTAAGIGRSFGLHTAHVGIAFSLYGLAGWVWIGATAILVYTNIINIHFCRETVQVYVKARPVTTNSHVQ